MVGISFFALNLFQSYISYRCFHVVHNDSPSTSVPILCSVSQGSVLGLLLFSIYMLPLGNLISHIISISYLSYADDLHVYRSIKPKETVTQSKSGRPLISLRLSQKKPWYFSFAINQSLKTNPVWAPSTYITFIARNLGIIYDQNLNFDQCIFKLVQILVQLRNWAKSSQYCVLEILEF